MAGKDHAILDLGEAEQDLQFTTTDYNTQGRSGDGLTSFPAPGSDRDTDRLLGGDDDSPSGEAAGGKATGNFWTMAFYQQFFDVDDSEVKTRLLYSMIPIPGKSFLQHHIRPKPDLYGPFWVCLTLIFSIGVSGNLASYFHTSLAGKAVWHYDFHKVTLASTAVFSYAGLLPAGLYGYLWWMSKGGSALALSFLELVCLYGYSLSIYVPVSILWLIPVNWLQWIFVLAGAGLSGAVLFTTVWPALRENAAKSAGIVLCVILALHLLLACGFMLYFFHVPSQPTPGPEVLTTVATVAAGKEAMEAVQNEDAGQKGKESVKEERSIPKKDKAAGEDTKGDVAGGGGGDGEGAAANPEENKQEKSAAGEEKADGGKPAADKPEDDKPAADKPEGDKPEGDKPAADKPEGDKPAADKPEGDKPEGDKPEGDKPEGDDPEGGKPAAEALKANSGADAADDDSAAQVDDSAADKTAATVDKLADAAAADTVSEAVSAAKVAASLEAEENKMDDKNVDGDSPAE